MRNWSFSLDQGALSQDGIPENLLTNSTAPDSSAKRLKKRLPHPSTPPPTTADRRQAARERYVLLPGCPQCVAIEFLLSFPATTKDRCPQTTYVPSCPQKPSQSPLGKLSHRAWLYPSSTLHFTRAAHLTQPSPKRACLWDVHWHRTGWCLVGIPFTYTLQTV